MICADEELSQLDTQLSQIYSSFYLLTKEIKSDQRTWMEERNKCKDDICIQEAYQTRIQELNNALANQNSFPKKALNFLKKSQEALKIETSHAEEHSFASEELFQDLFRFKSIKVEKPLVERVDYNNSKLKEMLGTECWDMHLEYSVGLVKKYEPAGESSRGVWEYHGWLSQEFSAWDVDMNGDGIREVMFLQHFYNYEYYSIIDKKLCKDFSYIPFDGNSSKCQKQSYPDIYYFYKTGDEREKVYPFCTLEQKVVGRTQKPAITNDYVSVLVVEWKGKSYLMEIYNFDHSYRFGSGSITMSLYGTKQLYEICQRDYILKNKKDNK